MEPRLLIFSTTSTGTPTGIVCGMRRFTVIHPRSFNRRIATSASANTSAAKPAAAAAQTHHASAYVAVKIEATTATSNSQPSTASSRVVGTGSGTLVRMAFMAQTSRSDARRFHLAKKFAQHVVDVAPFDLHFRRRAHAVPHHGE